MLDERKAAVLKAVVEEYISTAQPVGSSSVVRATHLAVSPATVRNDMALLEREGFLDQPHTSAGRIPTDKGYRFFVDHLTPALPQPQRQRVQEFFARAHGELEQMLHDTTRLLTDLTQYAALVVAPAREAETVRSVQLVNLGSSVALAVAVLSNATVEKAIIEIEPGVGDERLTAAGVHLAANLVGRPLHSDLGIPATGDHATDRLVERARQALEQADAAEPDQLFVGGAAQMASTFDAIETVRRVLAILEQQYVLVGLLRQAIHDHRLSVSIGTEHGVEPLAQCSIVVAPYMYEGAHVGTIGVLGPTRMNYPQAMAAVGVVSQRLSRALRSESQ
ncbi:MAG: heat-inducible transcriptional repressor HrcA [Acidimicrobiales bacterium]|nr:heat-inducible transcriptional repressor HrcA [Actinomycetota bacterium]